MPAPARKYDPGDRKEKKEEERRLAEAKRLRELAATGPPRPAKPSAPEVRPGPKDARFEGRAAKQEEARRLAERRAHELTYAVRMRTEQHSRWRQQAEAQSQTVDQRLRELFGEPGAPRKPEKDRRKR